MSNRLHRPRFVLGVAVNALYLALYFLWPTPGGGVIAPERGGDSAWEPPPFVSFPPREGRSRAKSYYAPDANQTSVYTADDLTLADRQDWKLLFSPLFVVPGREVFAPRAVHLRFTSFSYAPAFSVRRDFELIEAGDGSSIYRSALSYSASDNGFGGAVESMEATVPYAALIKLMTAEKPRIRIGEHTFDLSRTQAEALRDMQRCVQTRGCP
jgi:hypothetical protein